MAVHLVFRPVRPEDKPQVLELTAHTWGEEDGDYIQYVFDAWLADPQGEFSAVELDGQVVAIAKLTQLGSREWWFEGLRVDPEQRGQGIGTALNQYQIDLARRLGGGVIRYMTDGGNLGSQTIGRKGGFDHVLTFLRYEADPIDAAAPPPVLTPADESVLRTWLTSPLLKHTQGLCRTGWAVRALDEAALHDLLAAGNTVGLKDQAGQVTAWAVLRVEEDGEEDERLRIDHIDGTPAAIEQLARSLRALAGQRGKTVTVASLVDYPPLVQALERAGYRPDEDHFSLWVLELKL
jgi:GNAT superfamily N-acetyltransferase